LTSAPAASALDPLIVTSPLQRSGTTLLQRLLCSAPNTLIYGERAAQELEFFLSIHAYKVQEYAARRQANTRALAGVLQGQVNDWILELTPDTDGYLQALQEAAFAGIAYCRAFALAQGRPVWGFKYPAWDPGVLKMLRRLMPRARLLFIVRNLLPALRSAKAQHMLDTEAELRRLCQAWQAGMSYIAELGDDPGVLAVRYEDLIARPDEVLQAIAAFSHAERLDRSVLDQRINVLPGQQFDVQSVDGYVPPVELSAAELQIVQAVVPAA
jgi:hypothetical protein